jgi:hypothetical protein
VCVVNGAVNWWGKTKEKNNKRKEGRKEIKQTKK